MAIIYRCRRKGSSGPEPVLITKSVTATTSSTTYNASSDNADGYSSVTVNPQTHSTTYTPSPDTANNDMGANHAHRYVNTSGMIVPEGNMLILTNDDNVDVRNYATVTVDVPDPTLTGNAEGGHVLSGKTYYKDSLTKQTGTMTNRGAWTATGTAGSNTTIPEGYHNGNGYVYSPTQSPSGTYPVSSLSDNSSSNDMGSSNWYRYVSTSGMYKVNSGTYNYGTVTTNQTITKTGLEKYSGFKITVAVPSSHAMTSTVLWTNSSSSTSFAAQTITCSQKMCNFDYIRVIGYPYKSSSGTGASSYADSFAYGISSAYIPGSCFPDEDETFVEEDWQEFFALVFYDKNSSAVSGSNYFVRTFMGVESSTGKTIVFSDAKAMGASTTNNRCCVPYQVIGYNYSS